MAGTLFGLGLSQQLDLNGKPLSGCLLYIYAANAFNSPATAYKTSALTPGLEHTWPIAGDANGRIPQFWLPDGSYAVRLTDASNNIQFADPFITAIGPSAGSSSSFSLTADQYLQPGFVQWLPVAGSITIPGWVRMNGKTVGNTGSGATETNGVGNSLLNLFTFIWNRITIPSGNAICPVRNSSGTIVSPGADATTDFNVNLRQITLLDMTGISTAGIDDMGNGAQGWYPSNPLAGDDWGFAVGNATTPGSLIGSNRTFIESPHLPDASYAVEISKGQFDHAHDDGYRHPGGIQTNAGFGPFDFQLHSQLNLPGDPVRTTSERTFSDDGGVFSGSAFPPAEAGSNWFSCANPKRLGTWFQKI